MKHDDPIFNHKVLNLPVRLRRGTLRDQKEIEDEARLVRRNWRICWGVWAGYSGMIIEVTG